MSVAPEGKDIVPVLVLSGTVGVGKTTVMVELHDILMKADVAHACVERDALAYSWPERGAFNRETVWENLACVWANFQRAGARRLIIAGVVEDHSDVAVEVLAKARWLSSA